MELVISKTEIKDLDRVMDIYSIARAYMKNNGNPSQWGDSWPSKEKIEEDISKGMSYIIKDKETSHIYGVFAFVIGIDKTYNIIREGSWISDDKKETYGTIHRLASSGEISNIFSLVQKFVESFKVNLRIDTHKDNKKMNHLILKLGYKYCGLITPIEGGERLAYEKIKN